PAGSIIMDLPIMVSIIIEVLVVVVPASSLIDVTIPVAASLRKGLPAAIARFDKVLTRIASPGWQGMPTLLPSERTVPPRDHRWRTRPGQHRATAHPG